jgi:natural product biosynthesis luciferase-like monooxygenase protein
LIDSGITDGVRPFSADRPACVLIGDESLAVQCGETLLLDGWRIAAVVTDRATVRRWAAKRDIPVFREADALRYAPAIGEIDYIFSITNLSVLPDAVLSLARKAAINFHDGPLPGYSGLNTPAWAILNGETAHGITWHLMTDRIDRGHLLVERVVPIEPEETSLTLNAKCFAAGMETFEEVLKSIVDGNIRPTAQPGVPGRYYSRRSRPTTAGLIRWDESARSIHRLVRALQFGTHFNPLGTAKAAIDGQLMIVQAATPTSVESAALPGTIMAVDANQIVVATNTVDLAISAVSAIDGTALTIPQSVERFGLTVGTRFDTIDMVTAARIGKIDARVASHEPYWRERLAAGAPVDLPYVDRTVPFGTVHQYLEAELSGGIEAEQVAAAALAYLARLCDRDDIVIDYADPSIVLQVQETADCFASQLPLCVAMRFDMEFEQFCAAFSSEVRELRRHIGFSSDLVARAPELRGRSGSQPVAILIAEDFDHVRPAEGCDVTLMIRPDGGLCRWYYAPGRIQRTAVKAAHSQFVTLLAAAVRDPSCSIATLPVVSAADRATIMNDWNATDVPWRDDACIHQLIVEQAALTPDAVAIIWRDQRLSYRELDRRANRLARRLIGHGVGPDVLVGLYVDRSPDLAIGMLAIHKAGGAYVPLDPDYPADRIAYMIADAHMPVLLTTGRVRDQVPPNDAAIITIDDDWHESDAPVDTAVAPHNLAYVIYTSGSTGQPKGVMVEHRNVVNFFTGMDAKISAPGVWLAITSLSFDISVLELCWTLARGFTVVIPSGDVAAGLAVSPEARDLDFSLFYFASDAGRDGSAKYRLLLEGAKFADDHGFAAVWTPERHFHAFGGLYPNPAVTSAAIAAVTKNVKIRAGSVVLPLHHPARVAEEWSVVDNISGGRVGISFAAGWQPDDFVLRPENFAGAKQAMLRDIDIVRRLWRGEAVDMPGALGSPVAIRTLPRPVQNELPFWLTAAGNIETFEAAGRIGAFLLTHLLGQTVTELADKLAAYRRAWKEAGHSGEGHASLMLHSFVGPDQESVRSVVREPLIEYLRSSASLIKEYAWSFPAFKRRPGMEQASDVDLNALDEDEFDAVLEYSFERYYQDAGLFGDPDHCRAMVDRVRNAGVDEIACLIDFGIDAQTVLNHLPWLDRVRAALVTSEADAESLAHLMRRHKVTHLQCTPSMARMMADSGTAAAAFGGLKHLLIGGEAFPPRLATELLAVTGGEITNMYGPTETTIWSAMDSVGNPENGISLGRPLANQEVFILDSRGEPVPVGVPGEIVIGGKGVTRGYLNRPELTAERFTAHPLRPRERVYHTGDLGRFGTDGKIEFMGRFDHQVKVRGHRIELGEIEARLLDQSGVNEAVVIAREDLPGDVRICAYLVPDANVPPTVAGLRDALRAILPDFMVPSHFTMLEELPRTPNEKIDRKALSAPEDAVVAVATEAFVAPAKGFEEQIAAIWQDILKLPQVGVHDNFFDMGGHSLLAVQLHRKLRDTVSSNISLTDVFRFPTVSTLATYLGGNGEDAGAAGEVESRALGRLAALGRRRGIALSLTAAIDGG